MVSSWRGTVSWSKRKGTERVRCLNIIRMASTSLGVSRRCQGANPHRNLAHNNSKLVENQLRWAKMSAKVGVLEYNQSPTGEPRSHYKRKQAQDLVERGLAVWINRFRIQRISPGLETTNRVSDKNLQLHSKRKT